MLLKASAVLSCGFVLGSFAVEPVCVPAAAGTPLERSLSPDWRLQGSAFALHALNGTLYVMLSTANWLLIGTLDLQRGEELVNLSEVFGSHFRNPGLWCDVLALLGYWAEMVHLVEAPRLDGQASGAQRLALLQIFKMWRLALPEVQVKVDRYTFLEGVGWLFFSMAYFSHIIACILLALATQEESWQQQNWIHSFMGDKEAMSCMELYAETFYFAALSLTSVGYGDILITPLEHGVNAFLLLLGQLFTAKVCADLTWLTSTHNHWEAEHQAQRAQTWASLQNMQVPTALTQRVLAFQSYVAKVHREDLAQPIFSGLSPNLVQELRLCAYRKLVLQAPFLREQPKEVIAFIVRALVDEVYLPADFILRHGEMSRELYFVRRGTAEVFISAEAPVWGMSQEVAAYKAGNYFGELAMLTGKPRAAWVMATSYCVCSILPYKAVETLASEHPSAFTRLVQSMVHGYKLKASMRLEDVVTRMQAKYRFDCAEDAFLWMCSQAPDGEEDELTAKAFDRAMQRLKVPHLDRKIFWSELDMDGNGLVCFEEFADKIPDLQSLEASGSPRHAGRSVSLDSFNLHSRQVSSDAKAVSTNTAVLTQEFPLRANTASRLASFGTCSPGAPSVVRDSKSAVAAEVGRTEKEQMETWFMEMTEGFERAQRAAVNLREFTSAGAARAAPAGAAATAAS